MNEPVFPKVVIITINYNQPEYSIDCIKSILNSNYENYEVLLIDNGSETNNFLRLNEEISAIRTLKIKLIRNNNNLGYVGGINSGLKISKNIKPEYIIIMNNDTILHENAINQLIKCCQRNGDKAIVSGLVYWYDDRRKIQNTGKIFRRWNKNPTPIGFNEYDNGQFIKDDERDMLDDIFWLFPYALLEEIGYYSEYFWFNYEQADFAMRAKKIGYKLIFTPTAKLWHKSGVSIGGREKNPRKSYYTFQGKLIYIFTHFSTYVFLMNYLKVIGSIMAEFMRAILLRTSLKNALAKLLGFCYFHRWLIKRNFNDGKIPLIIK